MKILVIDDTKSNLVAAVQTIVGHDVTICSTHEEADNLLSPQYDEKKIKRLKEKYEGDGMDGFAAYVKARNESKMPYWDAVLSDLLMPAGRMNQGDEGLQFVGQEMPVGWSLALRAAMEGAKFVAVVTDMGHHDHPASAMLDSLYKHIFSIDGTKMLMTNRVGSVGIVGTECPCKECGGTRKRRAYDGSQCDCYCKDGTGFAQRGKNWGEVLKKLMDESPTKEE